MKNINAIVCFLFLTVIILSGCSSGDTDHIDADDVGMGKRIRLHVRPSINSNDVLKDQDGNVFLKWTDTGLIIADGMYDFDGNFIPPSVKLSISGNWYPWGTALNSKPKNCEMTTCEQSSDQRCALIGDSSTPVVKNVFTNENCYLANGLGIYLLVAKPLEDGSFPDPNQNADVASGPSSSNGFFTAHIGSFTSHNGLIKIDKAWSCNKVNKKFTCNAQNIESLVGSKIYLKVLDQYYSDNDADKVDTLNNRYVSINIKSGIYYPNFVSMVLRTLHDTIAIVTNALKDSILGALKDVIYVTILLYFAFTAFGFMTGLVKLTQTEAIVRLLKLGIVIMLTTPNNIIAHQFTSLYELLANFASNIIAQNLPNMPTANHDSGSGDVFGDQIGYLAVYDMILNQVMSIQVHIKIWALLFTSSIWLIPFLYILLVIIVLVVFRSLLLYVTAYVQISILILILPILAIMLLFSVTADLFQNWLKYMANSALLIVVATMGMGLVLGLMERNLADLLNYSVTKKIWWWFFGWWMPDDENALSRHLNATTYFAALIMALICQGFVEKVPKLADALSDAQLSPASQAFSALWQGMIGMVNEGSNQLKTFNAKYGMGALLNLRYAGKEGEEMEGRGFLDKWKVTRDTANSFFSGIKNTLQTPQRILQDDSLVSLHDNYGAHQKDQQISLLKAKNLIKYGDPSRYQNIIDTKKEELNLKFEAVDDQNVTISHNDRQINVDLGNDPAARVDVQGIGQIRAQDIRDAVRDGKRIDISKQVTNLDPSFDEKLQKVQELNRIEGELKKIRRG